MRFYETLLIAFGVSLDAFAVSAAGALTSRRKTIVNALLAAGFFGGFQFLMPLAGFFAAAALHGAVERYDHWIAFLLLAAVGGKMIFEGVRGERRKEDSSEGEFFDWKLMWIPAVATSIDAFAVGAGLAFADAPILWPAAAMGIVTGAVSACGVWLGARLGALAGVRVMSVAGGCAIVLVGANILRSHLVCG